MTSKLLRWITIFIAIGAILAATYLVAYTGEQETAVAHVQLPTVQSTAAALAIHTATATMQTATVPATFTPIPTFTNTPPPNTTPTHTFTPSPSPTETPLPTSTPTIVIAQTTNDGPSPTPEYTAVPTLETPNEVTNILLLGSDIADDSGAAARTDTIIIASINRDTKTASMLSIPRDLYVSIPGWWNNRINTALTRGDTSGYPGGGVQLLKDTIQHNFGIPIHYYARVDF
ncbi:MAG: LCP family protein, partial [Anaerolineales bacterium]|nr:LCP family protein [Anaerolineales bacterium]